MSERFRRLHGSVLATIRRDLRERPDVEHCGLLLAAPGSPEISACLIYPGPLRGRSFRLPEEWLLESFLAQRQAGLEIAGFFHTHPTGESLEPSLLDRSGHPLGSLVLVVGEGDWRAYRASSGDWQRVELEL